MHTPDGTLERGIAGRYSYSTTILTQPSPPSNEEVVLPHVISLPNKDDCENFANSVLRIQNQLTTFNLHKSVSEPAMVTTNIPQIVHDSSPDSPQPLGYDLNKGWMTGIFGCLRPVLSIIGKGPVNEIRNIQDDWEIPFEKITDLNFLGGGGQGMVFSGLLDNEPVAVKKVLDIKATDIRNLRKLNHPNIVKFKGVCTQSPCFSIIMEFCPYGPLYDLLKNQKNVVTAERVVKWAKQITSGMHYLHSQKIIHRDLKSPNVLIGENEIIKISDFGTHRTWSGVSEKMSFAGTVAWMAPEAIQEVECSEKVDIWSFGVVLWELLTCEVPYDGMEQSAIMYLVGCGKLRPPIPKTCPDGFRLIMEMCWKMTPRERPSFKLILNHLQIASVELLGNSEFFKTQESWKEEIKSQITQFKAQLQKHRIEYQLKEEMLIKKRETEIKHIRDIKELYDRKLEKVEQLYLELAVVLQQVEQYRQGGRKQNKKRLLNQFVRRIEKKKNNQSTTPTSPECSLTSPDSPQIVPTKAPLYAQLNPSTNQPETVITSTAITTQTSNSSNANSNNTGTRFRKRHSRSNSGSPRISGCSRTSSCRSSSTLVVDAGTQTDSMDLSETDLSPTQHSPVNTVVSARNGRVPQQPHPQRVILQEIRRGSDYDDEDEDEDERGCGGSNGNCVQLHYMATHHHHQHHGSGIDVFTSMSRTESRSPSPHNLYDHDDTLNRNHKHHHHHNDRVYSDEDNLETIGRKVTALKNGNIFSDMRISTENGNVTEELGEVIRKTCSETRNGGGNSTGDACTDSFTDEEGEVVYNNSLRRRSLSRRPIYPSRRSSRYKYALGSNCGATSSGGIGGGGSSSHHHYQNHLRELPNVSDEGNTSEYSVSPSSKSSTLESNPDRVMMFNQHHSSNSLAAQKQKVLAQMSQQQQPSPSLSVKRPNHERSDGSSDSDSDDNITTVTQIGFGLSQNVS